MSKYNNVLKKNKRREIYKDKIHIVKSYEEVLRFNLTHDKDNRKLRLGDTISIKVYKSLKKLFPKYFDEILWGFKDNQLEFLIYSKNFKLNKKQIEKMVINVIKNHLIEF